MRQVSAWQSRNAVLAQARICKHILTARQRLDESLLEEGRTDHTRMVGLVHQLLVLARQAHKLAAVPVSLILCARSQSSWKHRLRTITALPDWMIRIMEAEASGLADQALRVQQQAARRSWRAWLEKNTTAGAAKVHQLIREPIGFQAARGNAVDDQLKLRDASAAVGRANNVGTSSRVARRQRAAFPPTTSGRDAQGAHFLSRGHWAWSMTLVPPRALNELTRSGDRGADRSHRSLIEEKCEWPTLCNRIIYIAKAAGGVRLIGLLFAIVRVQCKLRRIEAKMWEARNTERLFWATQARGVERCVWQHGVTGPRQTMANRRCHGGGGWRRLRMLRWRKQTTAEWQSLG